MFIYWSLAVLSITCKKQPNKNWVGPCIASLPCKHVTESMLDLITALNKPIVKRRKLDQRNIILEIMKVGTHISFGSSLRLR